MTLKDRLAAEIRAAGPMGVDRFMAACLFDSRDGYYATRPRLGETGDFLTAPLVSQMFGEVIGAWAAAVWRQIGSPARVILAELGPGDGTLMADMLRAMRLDLDFAEAAELWLVEASTPLKAAQAERLARALLIPNWAPTLDALPRGAPIIVIANEFLDCLPIRQFVRTVLGWAERVVGLNEAGELDFGLAPLPGGPMVAGPGTLAPGAVIETSPAQEALAAEIAHRVRTDGGAALLIDYGEPASLGDTLQALTGNRKVSPLEAPGECDLTAHADFAGVAVAARAEGASFALIEQGDFLRRLGIEARAAALSASRPDRAAQIARQLARLTDADQMGRLFKAAAIFAPGAPPPGFEAAE
jgi:SAM-dependent MidA family methyltransferase